MGRYAWPDEDVKVLRQMLAEGKPSHEIAEVLGRKAPSVRKYVNNNQEKLNLTVPTIRGRGRFDGTQFDKEWYGVVPFGHWAITKPWRSQ